MKKHRLTLLLPLTIALGLPPAIHGQSVPPPDIESPIIRPGGVTRLLLATDIPNGFAPPELPGRVSVPPLERVWIVAPQNWPYPVQWTKDGIPIKGATSSPLILAGVRSADSGIYGLAAGSVQGDGVSIISTRVDLEVVRQGHVGNFSARVLLRSGKDVQILGFVIEGSSSKRLLIRAVGPTLERFGITNPAAQTRFRLFKGDGTEFVVIRPAVVYPPEYWSAIFNQAGAFALKPEGGERAHLAYETYDLPAGAYTVHVSDDSGQGGQALVEVYEFDTIPPLVPNR